jgi:3',5'-cyclic-AMP phosphodiesterase
MAVIAQLSDIHITAGSDGVVDDASGPVRALRAAVSSLLAMPARPDCVVLTGDLTERGLPAEYARLQTLLSPLPMPVHPLPGNHDDRQELRRSFAEHRGVAANGAGRAGGGADAGAYVQYAVRVAGARLICCDTTRPGSPGGELDATRLGWLDETLAAAPDRPTVVALHHPPFPIGIRFIDAMGFTDPAPFAAVVGRHPQVVRVISGHVHRAAVTSFAGTVGVTCPSTYRQLYLDLTRPGRAAVTGEPPGFAVHLINDDGTAVTHFCPVGAYRPLMEVE